MLFALITESSHSETPLLHNTEELQLPIRV